MSVNEKTIQIVKEILSVFFSLKGRSSFLETTDTNTFKTFLNKVCFTCIPYLKELLDQVNNHNPDNFLSVIGTLYDVCSASKNNFYVLVETEFKKNSFIFPLEQEVKDKIIFNKNYNLFFTVKQLNTKIYINMFRNLNIIKEYIVQTPCGKFQYLKQPAVSISLPCNIIKSLVQNGFVFPVLSHDSSRINMDEKWTMFYDMEKNKNILQCLTNVTTTYVKQLSQQIRYFNIPLDNKTCSNMCIIAWLSHSMFFHNGSNFDKALLYEIKKYEKCYKDIDIRKKRIENETIERKNAKIVMEELLNEINKRLQFKCCICQDFRKCKITTTLCNHSFHKTCLNQWQQVKNTCPLCRKLLNFNF